MTSGSINIPLISLVHWASMLTRSLHMGEMMAYVEEFRKAGAWSPSYACCVKLLSKKEKAQLVVLCAYLAGAPTPDEPAEAALGRKSLLTNKKRAEALLNSTSIFAMIDGNHRLAALLWLCINEPSDTWDLTKIKIPCIALEENTPLAICRALSAVTNETHNMARSPTFVDTLRWIADSAEALKAAGCRVSSAKMLRDHLANTGLKIPIGAQGAANKKDKNEPAFISFAHLQEYWKWYATIKQEGIEELLELQSLDAEGTYNAVHATHRCVLLKAPRQWKAKRGSFLLRHGGRGVGNFTPTFGGGQAFFIAAAGVTAQDVLWLVNRAWARWVENSGDGGGVSNREDWEREYRLLPGLSEQLLLLLEDSVHKVPTVIFTWSPQGITR